MGTTTPSQDRALAWLPTAEIPLQRQAPPVQVLPAAPATAPPTARSVRSIEIDREALYPETVVFDHARKPAHLAFDPPQPFQRCCLGFLSHGRYIPPRGM